MSIACNEFGEIDGEPPEYSKFAVRRMKLSELKTAYPELRPIVIDGILRRGETANIIASPKIGKSFLGIGLAWSVADGRPWLSHDVQQGRVLIIDNECHGETFTDRLYHVANSMEIVAEKYEDNIEVLPLRGANCDINEIQAHLSDIQPGYFTLVILDALYRTLPNGVSENDNAGMMKIYNKLDYYAALLDCAMVAIHHSSKGDQSDKSITDVGAGAGSISRAADTHLIIRQHEDVGFAVMESVTRSFKSPLPLTIQYEYPIWTASTKPPEIKRRKSNNEQNQEANDSEADQLVQDAIKPDAWLSVRQIRRETGLGETRAERAVARLKKADLLSSKNVKRMGRKVAVYGRSIGSSGPGGGPDQIADHTDSGPNGPVRPM